LLETDIGTIASDWKVAPLSAICEPPQYGFTAAAEEQGNVRFLRITDITDSGVKWPTVPFCECPTELLNKYLLASGDIVFARIGATTGKSYLITNPPPCVFASYLIRVRAKEEIDPTFLSQYFRSVAYWRQVDAQKKTNLKMGVNGSLLKTLIVPVPPLSQQRKIAGVLGLVQRTLEQQEWLIALTTELKKALLHQLFTQGLCGEPQKQTEIGPVPQSWEPTPLGKCCDIVSGSLSYTDFLKMASVDDGDAIECMGVKVSDMNLTGNENKFVTANAVRHISVATAHRKLIPPNTVVFPKRGAAIATNKKRLTTTWTVLDPNLMGVRAKDSLDVDFLFHWVQTFDLRRITDPGPTPQLNKKDLIPVLMPLPKEIDEQRDIANVISTIDRKLTLHQGKHAALTALFRTLLHQLMTAQLRVHALDLPELQAAIAKGKQ
jgi:type I restriction enzyme S subunit